MKSSNFIPLTIATGFLVLGTIVILFMPETLDRSRVVDPVEDMSSSDEESSDEGGLLDTSKKSTLLSAFVRKVEESRFIFASPMLCALAISFLAQSMHGLSNSLLFQFASERFHWSLANVSLSLPLLELPLTHPLSPASSSR